jgi:hypothetical protein
MANLIESNSFDATVYQLATTDPVQGGAGGIANSQPQSLTNRTRWLYNQIQSILAGLAGYAGINSPTFTGSPKGPTAAAGDNSTTLATTAYVYTATGGIVGLTGLTGGTVTLTAAQYGAAIINFGGALTSNLTIIVPTAADQWLMCNYCTGAFSLTVKTAAGAGVGIAAGYRQNVYCDGAGVYVSETDYTNVALLGAPTAPTQASTDSTTKIATTAFAQPRLGYTAVRQGTGNVVTLSWSGVALDATVDATDLGLIAQETWVEANYPSFSYFGNYINQGVRNIDSPTFAAVNTNAISSMYGSFGTSGYIHFTSGLVMQWMRNVNTPPGGPFVVGLPIAFPGGQCLWATGNYQSDLPPNSGNAGVDAGGYNYVTVANTNTGNNGINLIAIGV